MENKSSHDSQRPADINTDIQAPHVYNRRPCPMCGNTIFGMPGGRDAVCINCGYKDPCCSD